MNNGNAKGKNTKKYIFITGGVSSSLGKGLAAASIACLLERRGIKLGMLKMDPYINVDPGTMSPIQHGEVFVTDDGAETDLDLGHYERFTSLTLLKKNNFTTGQVYLQVIDNEREGKYLGKTVQVVPHITDEIKRRIHFASEDCDLLIGEIGGTVGDIESLPFLESIRQFAQDVGKENVLMIHLVLIPYLEAAGELKSKPAQHSVKELRSIGLFPDVILCRSDRAVDESILQKISMFCNIASDKVFQSIDVDFIYRVPLEFYRQGLDAKITEMLGIWALRPAIADIEKVIYNFQNPLQVVRLAVVGKYTELAESYKSLSEAVAHAAIANQVKVDFHFVDAQELENKQLLEEAFAATDAILVPGGFGVRGTEGKINAIEFARKNKIPFFGICLGMQLAIIEFCKNVVKIAGATSEEFMPGDLAGGAGSAIVATQGVGEPVIHYLKGQSKDGPKGGNMRLGAYSCQLVKNTLAYKIYGKEDISERHRHRLEFNNQYLKQIETAGMIISGKNNELNLVEIVELPNHPFFIACQFHPEFKSRPFSAHPIFAAFIKAAMKKEAGAGSAVAERQTKDKK
jgi:CTP synthase